MMDELVIKYVIFLSFYCFDIVSSQEITASLMKQWYEASDLELSQLIWSDDFFADDRPTQDPEILAAYEELEERLTSNTNALLDKEYQRRANRRLSSGDIDPAGKLDAYSFYKEALARLYFLRRTIILDSDHARIRNHDRHVSLLITVIQGLFNIEEMQYPQIDCCTTIPYEFFSYYSPILSMEKLSELKHECEQRMRFLNPNRADQPLEVKSAEKELRKILIAMDYKKKCHFYAQPSSSCNTKWMNLKREFDQARRYQSFLSRINYGLEGESRSLDLVRNFLAEKIDEHNQRYNSISEEMKVPDGRYVKCSNFVYSL